MFTEKQKEVLKKYRKSGSKDFSRLEYFHLNEIKKRCIKNIQNNELAKSTLLELEIIRKGGKV